MKSVTLSYHKKDIYLIGVGNYTEVIIELAQECGYHVKGLFHYNSSRNGDVILGIPILCSFQQLISNTNIERVHFAVTVGDNVKRNEIATIIRNKLGYTPNLIHPLSKISTSAILGTGCFTHAFSCIWTKATLEDDIILGPNSLVSHHSSIGNACYITSHSIIGSYVHIGTNTFIGLNATILPNITIGDNCIIGAKSNVTKSIDAHTIVKGNPAKKINSKNEN
ncbi:PglD-related sugar-binding protein [Wenyingzhuangia sp. IMCC45467]